LPARTLEKVMSKKRIYVHILLDRSGSMESYRDTTIDSFNEYVNSIKTDREVSARLSLTLFDSIGIDLVVDRQKARDVPKLTTETFVPRASTPLNDAIGRTVQAIDNAVLRENENVVLVILTDGLENASTEHTKASVKALLDHRQNEKNWLVIYLGANQDSFSEGVARGMKASTTMDFDLQQMPAAMAAVSRASRDFARTGAAASAEFTLAERAGSRR